MTSPRFRIKVFIFPQKTLSVLFCLFHPMAKSKWKKALLILPAATRDFNKVTFAVPRPFPTKSLASFLPKSFQHRPKEIWTLKSGPDESHSQCWMIIFAGWEQIRTNVRYPANRYCSKIKPTMQGGWSRTCYHSRLRHRRRTSNSRKKEEDEAPKYFGINVSRLEIETGRSLNFNPRKIVSL